MNLLLDYLFLSVVGIWVTWIFYVAVMHLKIVRDAGKLNKVTYVLGMPVLLIGLVLDTLVNWFVMSLIFFELPRETLVTARLQRHYKKPNWRGKLAEKFSVVLLDAFDPSGNHID